jgi:hypothetical protein
MSLNVPITEYNGNTAEIPIIHTLAARTLLGELQEGRLQVPQTLSDEIFLSDAVKQEGIRIALKYNLGSQWTSFVAVDQESNHQNIIESHSEEAEEGNIGELCLLADFSAATQSAPISWRPLSVQVDAVSLGGATRSLKSHSLLATSSRAVKSASTGQTKYKRVKRALGGIPFMVGSAIGASAPAPSPAQPHSASSPAVRTKGINERLEVSGSSDNGFISDDERKLHDIIMQQSSSGAFPSNLIIARRMGFDSLEVVIQKLPQELKSISVEIWITVLVCVFLEKKLPGEKDAWELVVEKGWNYVRSLLEDTTTEKLAVDVITS